MKFFANASSLVYRYVTVFIVVASPLFFIPKTTFAPEVTYHVTMVVATAIALLAYVLSALLNRSWQSISKLEFIAYTLFSAAVILSVLFAKDPKTAFFGEALNPLSGAGLLTLPVIVYLVRALPQNYRRKLKYTLAAVLGFSVLIYSVALMLKGSFANAVGQVFSNFSAPTSFAVYIGIFVIALFFFAKKAKLPLKQRIIVLVAGVVFASWAVTLATQQISRPMFIDSLSVGKSVLMNNGPFGIGAGDYTRAWQLYRPSSVMLSPNFNIDFSQGYSTVTTLFATIGIVGLLAFLLLTLNALYSTYRSYRELREPHEHMLAGFLAIILLYLAVVAWVLPLSYGMLVLWMVVCGLGLAKATLGEFHPSKKIVYIMLPLALLLLVNAYVIIQKTRAIVVFSKAQEAYALSGPTAQVGAYIDGANSLYEYDAFYRGKVEYIIAELRNLVSQPTNDQEALKTQYLNRSKVAVDSGLKAVTLNSYNYQNYVSLGRAYELAVPFDRENAFAYAKKSYEEAIKLYPENPYLYIILARLEAQAGTKEGVRTQLTEALNKKENFADALYLMSQLEASESKIDEALNYAIEAVKNAPNDPLTYIQAGLLYYGKKDYPNAVTLLTAALQRDQNNATVAYFLALALRDGGRPDLAKPIGDELLRRNPGNPDLEAFLKSVTPAPPVATTTPKTTKTPPKR